MASQINSALEKQLAEAKKNSATVGVWGTLDGERVVPSEMVELARRIIARAEGMTGRHASAVQIYENLNSFSLDGDPDLIRTIAQQPEVLSLAAAARNESFVIEPVPTTPAEAAGARRRGRRRR